MENGILEVQDVARILGIPSVKVLRWAYQGKIPCKFQQDRYVFRRREILVWARSHHFVIHGKKKCDPESDCGTESQLANAVERGGVYFKVAGDDVFSAIREAVQLIPFFSQKEKHRLFEELIVREEMASTGIGRGVAIPHPRHIGETSIKSPLVPLFFLARPVDFNSVDGEPVDLMFMMLSPDTRTHLGLLSRVSFLLSNHSFKTDLRSSATAGEVVSWIREHENLIKK